MYIGIANDINRRIYEHKNKLVEGFTAKYNVDKLVYLEETNDVYSAISREKQLKGWNRNKKLELIKATNPNLEEIIIVG